MKTDKIFYDDLYAKSCSARVTKATAKGDAGITLEIDRTIFFPTGGGQSCDLGKITAGSTVCEVCEVHEDKEQVYHELCFSSAGERDAALKLLTEGTEVRLEIDWDRRFDNMQRHCGEHILSGIFYREYGGVNRGFHMGEDYMTIDISLEEKPEYKELTFDMCKHVELCANEVIWSNAPVIRRVYATREECEGLPLRKKLAIEKDISIVCVGAIENAADCVACCGTHPATAGQVGLIKIFKVEVNKGMFRVYCEAGRRAYLDYEYKHDFFTHMANRLSATNATIYEQLARDDAKVQAVRNELYQLKRSVISERAYSLGLFFKKLAEMDKMEVLNDEIFTREYNDLQVDDLFEIGKQLDMTCLPRLLIFVSRPNKTCVLISNGLSCDCAKLVKENAGIYGGKGGGRNTSARAIFPDEESMDMFITLLKTHLLGKYEDSLSAGGTTSRLLS